MKCNKEVLCKPMNCVQNRSNVLAGTLCLQNMTSLRNTKLKKCSCRNTPRHLAIRLTVECAKCSHRNISTQGQDPDGRARKVQQCLRRAVLTEVRSVPAGTLGLSSESLCGLYTPITKAGRTRFMQNHRSVPAGTLWKTTALTTSKYDANNCFFPLRVLYGRI